MSVSTFGLETLAGCEKVTVLPDGFREPAPPAGIPMPNYLSLLGGYATYNDLATDTTDAYDNYADMMRGHPGFPGGVPTRPGGNGIMFGVRDFHGTEWWLTDAEGLTDSPEWEQRTINPALGDGSWLLDVRANAREVVLKGTLVGTSRAAVMRSVSEGSSALASPPRTGWLRWSPADGTQRQLPIALSGRIKTSWKNERWCDIEVEMLGIDIATPGAGVFFESSEQYTLDIRNASVNDIIVVEGAVPSPPTLQFIGPISPGTVVQLSDYSVAIQQPVNAGQTLVVNCQSKRVLLNGQPSRAHVAFGGNRWPLMAVGAVPVQVTKVGAGSILVKVTALW